MISITKKNSINDLLNHLNFILEDSLGGGGSETLFNDAQGKTYAQALLMMKINHHELMKLKLYG